MPIGERNLSPSFIQLRTPARINICSVTQQPPGMIVRYGGLLLALYNYNGLVAPGLSLYSGFIFTRFCCVLVVFPAVLPYTVRLARRLQYQFARSW